MGGGRRAPASGSPEAKQMTAKSDHPIISTEEEASRPRSSSPALLAVQDVDIQADNAASCTQSGPLQASQYDSDKLVTVTDPERWGDREPFVIYTVRTRKPDGQDFWQVKRRFQDFADLHHSLSEQQDSLIIIPPLPSKNNFEFKDKFNPEFTDRRRKALERFLSRLLKHPQLNQHSLLSSFLQEQNFIFKHRNGSSTSLVVATTATGIGSIVDLFGDALAGLGLFSRSNQVEERFEKMRELCQKLELHYGKMEEGFTRIYKAHRTMEEAMRLASKEVIQVEMAIMQLRDQLSMPSNDAMQEMLRQISVLYEDQAGAMHCFADAIKADVTGPVHEHSKYCATAKEALKGRDEKQYTVEELSHYLAKSRYQLNELRGGQASSDDPGVDHSVLAPLRSGAKVVTGYFSEQYDKIKGVDVLAAKQQKLVQVEKRIGDLEQALKQARETSEAADEAIIKEMDFFERVLQEELKDDLLPTLISLHKEYLGKTAARWSAIASE